MGALKIEHLGPQNQRFTFQQFAMQFKQQFGYAKVRYRGLAKNTARLYTLFGLANLLIGKSWSARNAKNAC